MNGRRRSCDVYEMVWLTAVTLLVAGCSQQPPDSRPQSHASVQPPVAGELDVGNTQPFLSRRATFQTKLIAPGPSPQPYVDEVPPDGIREVVYSSGSLSLKAWIYVPENDETVKHPALVCFHGGFAFGASDMYDCAPFSKPDLW